MVSDGFSLSRKLMHGSNITQVVWSRDGNWLAAASEYGPVRLWSTIDWQDTVLERNKWALSLDWSPDGKKIMAGSNDGGLQTWDCESGRLLSETHWSHPLTNMISTLDGNLIVSDEEDIEIWELSEQAIRRSKPVRGSTLLGHRSRVLSLALAPNGKYLASGSEDSTVRLWDTRSWKCLGVLEDHDGEVSSVAWSPDGRYLASSSRDRTVRIWDPVLTRAVQVLEGHTEPVASVSFSPDGRLLASKSSSVMLWQCNSWKCVGRIEEPDFPGGVVFHPRFPVIASFSRYDTQFDIRIWAMDIDRLLRQTPVMPFASYANSKVVLVGDSGVGKSGLGLVLTGQRFAPTESTHGRHVWTLNRSEVKVDGDAKENREILLWDLAGQPGYRLIHQLHLSDVCLALVVFDARSETDPFAGVRYWERALRSAKRTQLESSPTLKKFLISARSDRGGIPVSRERLAAFMHDLGFDKYFETSAKADWNIKELYESIVSGIQWDSLPRVTSTKLFEEIKEFLVSEKSAGRLLSTFDDLYRAFLKSGYSRQTGKSADNLRSQFETCIGRVESQGFVRRLHFGDLILLQPELLDDYASDLVIAARSEPDGLGSLNEEYAREGRFRMASQERIPDKSQEKLLLIATIEDLLRHEIALREDGELVFPAQFTREHPELPEPRGGSILFEFEGSPQSVYTTLAVRLAHSGMFKEKQMWRNAVSYSVADKTCSMLLKELDEGRGQLRVFFSEGADDVTRQQFEGFVFAHLHRRAVPESVVQRRVLGCPKCKEVITDRQSSARRALGKDTILCPVCETEFSIVAIEEHLERLDPSIIDEFDNAADYGRDYSAAQTTLEGKHSTGDFDVFLCHNTYDKPAVKHAGECLKAIGLLPWLDEWELQPGKPWQRGVENQILKAKSAAVFVSTSGMGPWQDLEQEALLREFVKRQCPVIPVLLPGYKNERSTGQPLELPIFLSGMTWVDMRKPKPNPFERLVWGITGSHPLNLDSPTRSLVNRLSPERLVQRLSELAPTEFDPERLRERVTESVPFTEPRQMRITRKRLPQPEKRKSHQSQRK